MKKDRPPGKPSQNRRQPPGRLWLPSLSLLVPLSELMSELELITFLNVTGKPSTRPIVHCPDGDSGTHGTQAERRRQEGISQLFTGATRRRRPTRRFR
jgi:hypothetical protein